MKPLDIPVQLPDFLKAAYDELSNAVADVVEKHNLAHDEVTTFLAAQLASMMINDGVKEVTPVLHTTLPVRIGFLDAHDETEIRINMMQKLSDEDAEQLAAKFTTQKFSKPIIAWKWLTLFFATNKNPKQLGEK